MVLCEIVTIDRIQALSVMQVWGELTRQNSEVDYISHIKLVY